jgi:hypothetical protein
MVVSYFTARQELIPAGAIGRAASVTRAVAYTALPVGALLGGWLLERSSSVRAVFGCAAAIEAALLVGLRSPACQHSVAARRPTRTRAGGCKPRVRAGSAADATVEVDRPAGGDEMPGLNAIVDQYVALWNEDDDDARRRRVAELYTEDAEYVMFNLDPFRGRDAIFKQISVAHRIYAPRGFRFVSSHDAVGHHHLMRFRWVMVDADGEADMIGTDVFVLDGSGRIKADYQFHDKMSSVPYDQLPSPDELVADLLTPDEVAAYREAFARIGSTASNTAGSNADSTADSTAGNTARSASV